MNATPGLAADQPRSLSTKGEETRARLVRAGKEIFEENGFLDARISDISERAGLSHGSFYTYFESKEQIFREVALGVEESLIAPLDEVILSVDSRATPQERIREAMRRYLESYRRAAKIMGVIEQVSRHDHALYLARLEWQSRSEALVADSIARLQRHEFVDPRLDPVITAAVLGSMTNRFPEMWLTEGRLNCTFDDGVAHLTTIYLNALGLPRNEPAA